MNIIPITITIEELIENYIDDRDDGVVGYNHRCRMVLYHG